MELYTGSAHTVISERVWEGICKPVLSAPPHLNAYGGFTLPVLSSARVTARFRGRSIGSTWW